VIFSLGVQRGTDFGGGALYVAQVDFAVGGRRSDRDERYFGISD